MMNHIAVIFRGHIRTWHLIKNLSLPIYDKLAKNVDYYFVTWHLPNFGVADILEDFNNRNLVKMELVPVLPNFYNSWYGSSWLPYNILPYKRLREKTLKYDAVIDTRPDVLPWLDPTKTILKPEDNIVYTTQLELHHNYHTELNDIAIQDWFLIMKSEVYDIMSQRFIMTNEAGSQVSYRLFAESEGFSISTLDYIQALIARPNLGILSQADEDFDYLRFVSSNWVNLTREEKIEYAQKYNVRVEDYDTTCLHAKI